VAHDDVPTIELTSVDTTTAEWVEFPLPQIGAELDVIPLLTDPDTGMQAFKLIYRAGFTNGPS
jgi:hypothetical protein